MGIKYTDAAQHDMNSFMKDLRSLKITQLGDLPLPEQAELINRAKEGQLEAQNELILGLLPLIVKLAGRCGWNSLGTSDLVNEGVFGVLNALKTYNPKKGTFITHAYRWIQSSIIRARLSKSYLIAVPPGAQEVMYSMSKNPSYKPSWKPGKDVIQAVENALRGTVSLSQVNNLPTSSNTYENEFDMVLSKAFKVARLTTAQIRSITHYKHNTRKYYNMRQEAINKLKRSPHAMRILEEIY